IYATNFAPATVSGAPAALTFYTNTIAATNLVVGTNVIAVEVHQSTATSSDIGWEMELDGITATPVRANITRLGANTVIYWTDSSFALEQSPDAGTPSWTPAATNSPVPVDTSGLIRIFRLKK
ncbi:MAG: hypothetical protein QOF48_3462, partial [Verrucomicrobiota bacterium]